MKIHEYNNDGKPNYLRALLALLTHVELDLKNAIEGDIPEYTLDLLPPIRTKELGYYKLKFTQGPTEIVIHLGYRELTGDLEITSFKEDGSIELRVTTNNIIEAHEWVFDYLHHLLTKGVWNNAYPRTYES